MLLVVPLKYILTKKEILFWLSYRAYKFVTTGLWVPSVVSLWFWSMRGRWPLKIACTRPPCTPENQRGNRCTEIQSTRHLINIPFLEEIWKAPYTYPTQFLLLVRTAETNINFQLEDFEHCSLKRGAHHLSELAGKTSPVVRRISLIIRTGF